ncbi:MAG: MCP four helix bundle domain-containing protein, partial [Spirochaetota bacterium]
MKLGIRKKLLAGFLSVAVIALVMGVFAIATMRTMADNDTFLFTKCTVPIVDLLTMTDAFKNSRIYVYRHDYIAVTQKEKEEDANKVISEGERFRESMKKFELNITTDEWIIKYKEFKSATDNYYTNVGYVLTHDTQSPEVKRLQVEIPKLAQKIEGTLLEMTNV